MIESIRQGLQEDGIDVPVTKLCVWFGVPRRTVYYKPVKKSPIVQDRFAKPIKEMIEENPGGFKSEVQHLTNKVRCFAWEIKNISNFRQMSAFA